MELVVFLITRDIVFCELEICYIYECCIRKMIHTRCEVGYGHAVKWSDKILQERKKNTIAEERKKKFNKISSLSEIV